MSKEAIIQTLHSGGWELIEQMFKDEILEGKKPTNFKTEGKDYATIAVETMAREKAAKMVLNVLSKLQRIKNGITLEKEVYR